MSYLQSIHYGTVQSIDGAIPPPLPPRPAMMVLATPTEELDGRYPEADLQSQMMRRRYNDVRELLMMTEFHPEEETAVVKPSPPAAARRQRNRTRFVLEESATEFHDQNEAAVERPLPRPAAVLLATPAAPSQSRSPEADLQQQRRPRPYNSVREQLMTEFHPAAAVRRQRNRTRFVLEESATEFHDQTEAAVERPLPRPAAVFLLATPAVAARRQRNRTRFVLEESATELHDQT